MTIENQRGEGGVAYDRQSENESAGGENEHQ